jgi:hypothetical protein
VCAAAVSVFGLAFGSCGSFPSLLILVLASHALADCNNSVGFVCYKETQRGHEGKARNRAHPPLQADTEHSRGGRSLRGTQTNWDRESNNHSLYKPKQTRPLSTDTDRKTAQLVSKQAGRKQGRCAQARHKGAEKTPALEPTKPRQQASTGPPSQREEGGRVTGHRNAQRWATWFDCVVLAAHHAV